VETCFWLICFQFVQVEDLLPPGTIVWNKGDWQVEIVVRNDDTTDRGCRLTHQDDGGGRLDLDAFFLAGRVHVATSEVLHADGPAKMGLHGLSARNQLWGITSMDVTVTGREIVADIPGDTVANLLREWSRNEVKSLSLFGADADRPLVEIKVPDLVEASNAFLDCYSKVPIGEL
jgi:hypothetical protein